MIQAERDGLMKVRWLDPPPHLKLEELEESPESASGRRAECLKPEASPGPGPLTLSFTPFEHNKTPAPKWPGSPL